MRLTFSNQKATLTFDRVLSVPSKQRFLAVDQVNMMIGQIRRMKVRQLLQQAINFGLVVASGTLLRSDALLQSSSHRAIHHSAAALMIWKSLMIGNGGGGGGGGGWMDG